METQIKIGPNIVRRWFDTVINPLLRGLEIEKRYLLKKNWSWRHYNSDLEAILPLRMFVPFEAIENLDQFFEAFPGLIDLNAKHDSERKILIDWCNELQIAILNDDFFKEQFNKYFVLYKSLQESKSSHSFFSSDINPSFIAEHIVNGIEKLPEHYTTTEFWNEYGAELRKVLMNSKIKDIYTQALNSGSNLLKTVEITHSNLKDLRQKLASEFDQPYV